MRLAPLILWLVGSILWLPWFVLLIRLCIDLALGVPIDKSAFLNAALVGPWPTLGWRHWTVVSCWPILALAAMIMSAWAWRIKSRIDDYLLYAGPLARFASVLAPPLALWLNYREARQLNADRNEMLADAAAEAGERISLE